MSSSLSSLNLLGSDRLLFLNREFLATLDSGQVWLMNLANLPFAGYAEEIFYQESPMQSLLELIYFEAPLLVKVGTDEDSVQETLI